MIYTVTLNPAIDYVMHCESLCTGAINRSGREACFAGGEGINVATIVHRLGAEVTALGFLAGFTGEEIRRSVEAEGIKTDFITLPGGMTRINVKLRAGGETDINAAGPAVPGTSLEALLGQIGRLEIGDYLVLAGNIPATLPPDTYARILQRVPKFVRVFVDTEGQALLSTLPYHPFLIKPNHHELAAIFGEEMNEGPAIQRAAHRLQEMGAKNVLVSRAEQGALLFDEKGHTYNMAPAAGTLVDSVGAGDSMLGGFLAEYAKNGDLSDALICGAACGGATAFTEGLATADAMRAELARVQQREHEAALARSGRNLIL